MSFIDLIEQETDSIDDLHESVVEDFISESFDLEDADDIAELKEMFSYTDEDIEELKEALVRRVSADGTVRRVKNRKTRKRRATLTTGMSRAALARRGRMSARSLKRNPGAKRRGARKRKRALRQRKLRGL